MEYKISKSIVKEAVRMVVDVNVVLGDRALIRVCFFSSENDFMPIHTESLSLDGEAYIQWGQDDSYIRNYIFSKLDIKIDEISDTIKV